MTEHYGFEDKRGQEGYESWDLAAEKYLEIISPYVVEEELNANTYDGSLKAPELTALRGSGAALTLQWKKAAGAAASGTEQKHKKFR